MTLVVFAALLNKYILKSLWTVSGREMGAARHCKGPPTLGLGLGIGLELGLLSLSAFVQNL